jgi:hypothetical protein
MIYCSMEQDGQFTVSVEVNNLWYNLNANLNASEEIENWLRVVEYSGQWTWYINEVALLTTPKNTEKTWHTIVSPAVSLDRVSGFELAYNLY